VVGLRGSFVVPQHLHVSPSGNTPQQIEQPGTFSNGWLLFTWQFPSDYNANKPSNKKQKTAEHRYVHLILSQHLAFSLPPIHIPLVQSLHRYASSKATIPHFDSLPST